jgi:hypothetical protein
MRYTSRSSKIGFWTASKCPKIDDRNYPRIELIRGKLRSLRSSIFGCFHAVQRPIFELREVYIFLILCVIFSVKAEERKVALLFLTVGDLHHPELWKKALDGHEGKFSLYVHSKNPMQDSYFQRYRIGEIVPTSWSIHMKAWKALLKEAFQDERNEKFVFLSESCIPLMPLHRVYNEVLKTPKTHMSYGSAHWFAPNRVVSEVPESHRFVNQEWIILNRRHAQYFIEDEFVIEFSIRHDMDIESYPSVYLSLLGELNDDHVLNQMTTFVDWHHHNAGDSSPYHFFEPNPLSMQLFEEAKASGCFFARKFIRSFPVELLYPLIDKEAL